MRNLRTWTGRVLDAVGPGGAVVALALLWLLIIAAVWIAAGGAQ